MGQGRGKIGARLRQGWGKIEAGLGQNWGSVGARLRLDQGKIEEGLGNIGPGSGNLELSYLILVDHAG